MLKYERQQQPGLLGSSVFGVDGIHERLQPFVVAWRAAGTPRLFVASADIRKCYDTMKQVGLWLTGKCVLMHSPFDTPSLLVGGAGQVV